MKTSLTFKMLPKLSTLAILVFGLAGVAKAGPSIDYWQRMDRAKADRQAAATTTVTPPANPGACTDSKTVAVTEAHKDWANGKGPTHFVQVGTKQVCNSCGGTTTVSANSWVNGKGPTESMQVPVEHNCTSSGCKTEKHS